MKLDKKQRDKLKEEIKALGYNVNNVQNVISNGKKIRLDLGQGTKWQDEKRMIAVLIEVNESDTKD